MNGNDLQESVDCSPPEKIEIELLLEGIYRHYGFDFRNYSFPTLRRKVWHRVRSEHLNSISSLQNKILHDSKTMRKLFDDFSINVTEMFRDPEFFVSFRKNVIPKLREYPYFRIWHAGCSTGEEAISMAILLHEEGIYDKARIYATDMNQYPLVTARKGTFPLNRMKKYTENYLNAGGRLDFSEYYTVDEDVAIFQPSLVDKIVFAQHNLATDKSFNEFNVVICRNVLIYFDQMLKERVLDLFYDSLPLGGYIGLGNKESIKFTSKSNCYLETDFAQRLFKKIK